MTSDAQDLNAWHLKTVRRIAGMRFRAAATLVACLIAYNAAALEVERSEARYTNKRYEFELVAMLDAPIERVAAVLKDYEHYPDLDPRILNAKVLERAGGDVVILATTLRACFGPFCRNVKRVERVEESPQGLAAVADPARSDVRFGETRTVLSTEGARTKVSYHTSMTPSFWIPAIVGRRLMLSTLEDATHDLFANVEERAKGADVVAAAGATTTRASDEGDKVTP